MIFVYSQETSIEKWGLNQFDITDIVYERFSMLEL